METKQKEIRRLINIGYVTDITNWSDDQLRELGHLTRWAISFGVYGRNGIIGQADDGKLYGTACRCTNCFYIY